MASEKARERDVHSYYQTWLESFAALPSTALEAKDDRFHLDGSALKASRDDALIAFTQLGCLRLGAKRVIVTLIASERQYILAEATKSLSISSGHTDDAEEDDIWFGNASIPRSQGVSEHALYPPAYTAVGLNGHSFTAPALVINDLTEDERFHTRAFAGKGVTFYCGVPIIAKSGNSIGVYTVMDDKPRDGVSAGELEFLRDMSRTVMRHFETVKNNSARFRGERMVQGLGNFMKRRMFLYDEPEDETVNQSVEPEDEWKPITKQFKGMDITNADPDILRAIKVSNKAPEGSAPMPHSKDSIPSERGNAKKNMRGQKPELGPDRNAGPSKFQKVEVVFTRAASIILQCADADGVVFFDASPVNLAKRSVTFEANSVSSPLERNWDVSDGSMSESPDEFSSGPSTDSEASTESQSRILQSSGQKCQILGYALNVSSASTAKSTSINTLGLTERSLKYFIRRYPRGKTFFFNQEGDISTSEGEGSDDLQVDQPKTKTLESAIRPKSRKISTKFIAKELSSVVPGARNIIWLPLWDFSNQRWRAGLFLWSRRPDRLLTVQDDMAYLKTFGHSIMNELSRIDAEVANEAKSAFIANVSHELRSPLHGILGSIEFLQDTPLNAFQSSMTLAVETCAKTLLDTVEHVLDYSKINEVSAKSARFQKSRNPAAIQPSKSSHIAEGAVELAVLIEDAIEAVYAGQTFRTPQQDSRDELALVDTPHSSNNASKPSANRIQRVSNEFSGNVRLILNIEKRSSWWVRTQPGAIRRIVMNILGNSLKYTEQGTIIIALGTNNADFKNTRVEHIYLTVKDTGRGMSSDFLQNHAFVPFSQESQFSVGTGLGLSIVRQILDSIDGKIELQSQKDVGTEVKISLNLPKLLGPPPSANSSDILSIIMPKLRGLTLCVLKKPPGVETLDEIADEMVENSMRSLFETWFGMKTMSATSMDAVVADFFVYAEPPSIENLLQHHGHDAKPVEIPLIIVATNAFECAALIANGIHKLTELGRVLEVISQPCGPQKLARAFQRCFVKLDKLSNTSEITSPAEPETPEIQRDSHSQSRPGDLFDREAEDENIGRVDKPQLAGEQKVPLAIKISVPHGATSQTGDEEGGILSQQSSSQSTPNKPPRQNSIFDDLGSSLMTSGDQPITNAPPVLLVDDNDINLNLLVAFVKKAGHPYVKARNGLEAVTAFERAGCDSETAFKYVFMDIGMPVMDGMTATREIRQLERKQKSKEKSTIIVLTGLAVQGKREEILQCGADYCLSKPIKFKELKDYLHL